MNRFTRTIRLAICYALAMGAFPFSGGARSPDGAGEGTTLDRVRETYERELARIRDGQRDAAQAIENQILVAMVEAEKTLQQQGRLDDLLMVRAERERFVAQRDMPADAIVGAPPELGALQRRYVEAHRAMTVVQAERVKVLGAQYVRSLQALMEQLTRDDDVAQALLVKQERDGVPGRPEMQAAEFALAEAAARAPAAGPPATRMAAATAPRSPSPGKKYSGSPRARIARRYDDLCRAFLDQNWEQAITLVEPDFVAERGVQGVMRLMQSQFNFLRLVDVTGASHRAGDITISDDGLTARLVPMFRRGNDWRNLGPTHWVDVDGDWFIRLNRSVEAPAGMLDAGRPGGRPGGGGGGDGNPHKR